MKNIIIGIVIGLMVSSSAAFAVVGQVSFIDTYKTVTVKECTGGGNFVEGAIIGGLLGSLFGNDKSTGIGALLGGAIAEGDGKTCKMVEKQIYDHTTISFTYEGWSYSLNFNKNKSQLVRGN